MRMGGQNVDIALFDLRPRQRPKAIRVRSDIRWSNVVRHAINIALAEKERPIAGSGAQLNDRRIASQRRERGISWNGKGIAADTPHPAVERGHSGTAM